MEIVHLILGKANPDRMNGVNKAVHFLATSQSKLGHAVEVWGITPTPENGVENRAYQVRLFRSLRNKFTLDPSLVEAICNAPKETVFHLHGGFIPEFYHAARHLRKSGHRYIFTSHGSYNTVALQKSGWVKKLYFPLVEKAVLAGAKALHFLGKSEFEAVENLFPNRPKVLVPNGQEIPAALKIVRSDEKTNGPVFGFCGRLDGYTKGLDLMLAAFQRYVKEARLPGELWIIGDGGDRPDLENRVKEYGLEDRVRFFGSRFGAEKEELLRKMDVFLHPSRNEGMPMAVLEACALGVPVLISRETNVGEYVETYSAGWVMRQNTAEEQFNLLCSIHHACGRPEFSAFGENALRMIREEFAWEKVAGRLIEVYAA